MERITNHRKLSKKTLGINQYITQLTKKEMIYNETKF